MNDLYHFVVEEHRRQLRNPHKPREGKRWRFPRLWPRFNYRQPKQQKKTRGCFT